MEGTGYTILLEHLKVDPKKIPLCIETGTHLGVGAQQWSTFFDKVITIELSEELFKKALETLDLKNVKFLNGLSHEVLAEIISDITEPYMLFLDAHGSGGDTTYDDKIGRYGSPVIQEIEAVADNLPELIVIDDLSDFFQIESYPDPYKISEAVSKIGDYSCYNIWGEAIHKGVLVFELNR